MYQRPETGWGRGVPRTPEAAREWVRWAKANGADGLKLGAERADIMAALGQVARQWTLVTPRSDKWNKFLQRLKDRDVTLDPTMTTYLTGRDVVKRMNEPWHSKYTIRRSGPSKLPVAPTMAPISTTGRRKMKWRGAISIASG